MNPKFFILFSYISFILCQTNLLKDGYFSNYSLVYSCGYGSCLYDQFVYLDSWYGLPDKMSTTFQVKSYETSGTQSGLDTISSSSSVSSTCQDVILQSNKTYLLEFIYFLDFPQSKDILVIFMNQTILNTTLYTMSVNNYSNIFRALIPNNTICFQAPLNSSKSARNVGVLVDNVTLQGYFAQQYVTFQLEENWDNKTLKLISNFSIDISKISSFNETMVSIQNISALIMNIWANKENFLEIMVDISLIENPSSVQVILPNYWYTTNSGKGTKFYIVDMEDKRVRNTNLEFIKQWFSFILESINTLTIIGFTALLFRLISFANITILYIFLDVNFLNIYLRQSLEQFAIILIGTGPISLAYKLTFGNEVYLPYLGLKGESHFYQNKIETYGSNFSMINLTVDAQRWCMEDIIVIIVNCVKIMILWIIAKKIKESSFMKEESQQWNFTLFKTSLLLQVLSVSPIWMISAVVGTVVQSEIGNQNFLQKINQTILVCFLILFIYLWYCLHQLLLKKEKRKIEKNQTTQHIQQKQQKKNIFSIFDRIQSFDILYYILFDSLIGFQNSKLFFSMMTICQFGLCFTIIWYRQKSISFFIVFIRKLFEITIHLSFLSLFTITKLNQSFDISIDLFHSAPEILSSVIFYSFIAGCCFEAILIVLQLCYQLIQVMIWIYKKLNRTDQTDQMEVQGENKKLQNLNENNFDIANTNYEQNYPQELCNNSIEQHQQFSKIKLANIEPVPIIKIPQNNENYIRSSKKRDQKDDKGSRIRTQKKLPKQKSKKRLEINSEKQKNKTEKIIFQQKQELKKKPIRDIELFVHIIEDQNSINPLQSKRFN